jgi:hypothetical protein
MTAMSDPMLVELDRARDPNDDGRQAKSNQTECFQELDQQ